MFTTLFVHTLLPTRLLQMEDFLGGTSMIPLRGTLPSKPIQRNDGLLSALSSYLLTPYSTGNDQVPDATESDVESTLCTIDCITSCRLDELYGQIMYVRTWLVEVLSLIWVQVTWLGRTDRSCACAWSVGSREDSDSGEARIRRYPHFVQQRRTQCWWKLCSSIRPSMHFPFRNYDQYPSADTPAYWGALVGESFLAQYPSDILYFRPIVFEHISALLSAATQYSVLLIERAVVGLFRLCSIIVDKVSPACVVRKFISFLLRSLPCETKFSLLSIWSEDCLRALHSQFQNKSWLDFRK